MNSTSSNDEGLPTLPDETLRALLSPLCSTDEDQKILDEICRKVVTVADSFVEFEELEFNFTKDDTITTAKDLPKSFGDIAQVATSITWDCGGPEAGFELHEDGSSAADGWIFGEINEQEKERIRAAAQGDPADAFVGGQNGLFFDPTRNLTNGEPALAFIDHGVVEWVEVRCVDHLDYRQIFLRLLSDAMTDTQYIPEISF